MLAGRGDLLADSPCTELDRMPLAAKEAHAELLRTAFRAVRATHGAPATWVESLSMFMCLDLCLCVRYHVNNPVAHSALA